MNQLPPPADIAAERGIIGGCLTHGSEVVSDVVQHVESGHFWDRRHQKIFHAINLLWDQGQPVDEITVTSLLSDQHQLESVGGAAYLAELADILLGPAHVGHYAKLVKEKALLRQIISACHSVIRKAEEKSGDAGALIEEAQRAVNTAATSVHAGELLGMRELIPQVFSDLEQRQQTGSDPSAVPWGFAALDRITGGMRKGHYIAVAGRPSMGKTSFATRVATHVAVDLGQTVLFATREQPSRDMGARIVCCESRINTKSWFTGQVSPGQVIAAQAKRQRLEQAPMYWLDGRAVTLRSLEARARALQARQGLSLVVIDYIQLMAKRPTDECITEVSNGLKDLAKELDVPFMILSQLNREVEKRTPPKPMLSDLRGSGSIEQDSDEVLLFYRPYYYDKTANPEETQVALSKQRNGPTGFVYLNFLQEYTRFEDQGGDPNPQKELYRA